MGNLFYTYIVSLLVINTVHIIKGCTICEEFPEGNIPGHLIFPLTDDNTGIQDLDLQREYLEVFHTDFHNYHSNSENGIVDENEDESFADIGPETFFFDKSPTNMQGIKEFKEMLMNKNGTRDVFAAALKYRDEINLSLWLHGFIGAIVNREDGISPFVPLVELKPDLMVPSRAISQAKIESQKPLSQRTCIAAVDKEAGQINGIENELWYFREDLMVNSHHWYWHLVYPVPTEVLLDRQGELFYYMHQSILARYHSERLSNDLPPVVPLDIRPNLVIEEPYYSFLEDSNSGFNWNDRSPNTRLKDVQRFALDRFWNISVAQHKVTGNRLLRAAETGFMVTPRGVPRLDLKNIRGVDSLARTAESLDNFSVNKEYYGDWHNQGHILIAFLNDPLDTLGLSSGVMGDTATAMRDVIFYRWHTTVTNLIAKHKDTLEHYSPRGGELQLVWPGVFIEDIEVNTVGRSLTPINTLYTFWSERRFDMSKGLDFQRNTTGNGNDRIDLCVDHLNHDEFEYSITVIKSAKLGFISKATVRIFLAPRFDENNRRYSMEEQRLLFFVLDTFSVNLKIGRNVITQSSKKSSLTLEFAKSLYQLKNDDNNDRPQCGCGWPHHLLLPKGKPTGMTFDLFVMVTNGDEDAVVSESPVNRNTCSQGYLYCGRINDKYPDSKPMGYPFDRKPYTVPDFDGRRPVADLEEFTEAVSNMHSVQVNIVHQPNRKDRPKTTF